MIHHLSRLSPFVCLRSSSCSYQRTLAIQKTIFQPRPFHGSRPSQVPLLSLPTFLIGTLKTTSVIEVISMFSNLSATLLLLRFYKKQSMSHWTNKALACIPLLGLSLFIAVGLDQAPNTSRLRLIYLNEQQEQDLMNTSLNNLLQEKQKMILPRNDKIVVWMQEIVDNLAAAAVDDVRAPVQRYAVDKDQPQVENKEGTLLIVPSDDLETRMKSTENIVSSAPKLKFQVDFVNDNNVMNALCIGSRIFVFNLFYACTEGDTERMATILAHEMAHTLQRHIADKHGAVKLMSMFSDIARCLLWMVTDIFGP